MPNHIHLILIIEEEEEKRALREAPLQVRSTLSKTIGYIKMNTSKKARQLYGIEGIWQRSFYDHIIRTVQDYEDHLRYIYENPLRWELDELHSAE